MTQNAPPKWMPDAEGAAVIVCRYDIEKNEPIGSADLFSWWDTHGIAKRVNENLALARRNFPTPEEIYKWTKAWDGRDIDFCEICEGACAGYDCRVCPIRDYKDELESDL